MVQIVSYHHQPLDLVLIDTVASDTGSTRLHNSGGRLSPESLGTIPVMFTIVTTAYAPSELAGGGHHLRPLLGTPMPYSCRTGSAGRYRRGTVARLGVMPRWLLVGAGRWRPGSAARGRGRACRCRRRSGPGAAGRRHATLSPLTDQRAGKYPLGPAPPISRRSPSKGGYGGVSKYREDSLDPFIAVTALSAITERILLISTVHVLFGPWHPLHLAKFGATLDHISGGRWGSTS